MRSPSHHATGLLLAALLLAMPAYAEETPVALFEGKWLDVESYVEELPPPAVGTQSYLPAVIEAEKAAAAEKEKIKTPVPSSLSENPPVLPSWQPFGDDQQLPETREAALDENDSNWRPTDSSNINPYSWQDAHKVAAQIIINTPTPQIRLSALPPPHNANDDAAIKPDDKQKKPGPTLTVEMARPQGDIAPNTNMVMQQCMPDATGTCNPTQPQQVSSIQTRTTRALELDRQTLQALRAAVKELKLEKELDFLPLSEDSAAPKMDMPTKAQTL
jgi:hypothetical protein